uniref:DUF218 domain-containing protein n=1 Tax=Syphacia muris TaxID=451379 RepID=A0A0N5AT51_9BILA
MGCVCVKRENERQQAARSTSVYMGLAMMQASRSALLLSGENYSNEIQQEIAERFIRKAKAQGCTVTIADGCLYIDYNFVGFLPQYKT